MPLACRRPLLLAALGVLAPVLAGCGTTTVPAGPDAADPACADVIVGAPQEMLGLPRHETDSQGTLSWGSGEDTIVLRCGVAPPGPTTELCTTLADSAGREVDWIVHEEDGIVLFTTYGRTPAIDISVPRSAAPDQPSAVALEFTQQISAIPAETRCVGPGDAA